MSRGDGGPDRSASLGLGGRLTTEAEDSLSRRRMVSFSRTIFFETVVYAAAVLFRHFMYSAHSSGGMRPRARVSASRADKLGLNLLRLGDELRLQRDRVVQRDGSVDHRFLLWADILLARFYQGRPLGLTDTGRSQGNRVGSISYLNGWTWTL